MNPVKVKWIRTLNTNSGRNRYIRLMKPEGDNRILKVNLNHVKFVEGGMDVMIIHGEDATIKDCEFRFISDEELILVNANILAVVKSNKRKQKKR